MNALSILLRSACACAAMVLSPASGMADPVADFYRGKTINMLVGFPPGGGYDLYARVLAPYFTKHIPGNPQIVTKSMLGGSGILAAGYMTKITPQDGTSLGVFLDTTTLGKVLGGPGDFDPVKLVWIGRIVSTATVSVVWHTSPVQSVEEAKHKQILIAGTVPSNSAAFIPTALNDLIGTKFKVILGFRGSPDQALAMLREEVNAIGGMSWEAIQANHHEWLEQKQIRVLYTQGAQRIKRPAGCPGPARFCRRRTLAQHPHAARQRTRHRTLDRRGAWHSRRPRRRLA